MRILVGLVPIERIFFDLTNSRHVPFATEDQAIDTYAEERMFYL